MQSPSSPVTSVPETLDLAGYAALLSQVLWESYGQQLASYAGDTCSEDDARGLGAYLRDHRQRRFARCIA